MVYGARGEIDVNIDEDLANRMVGQLLNTCLIRHHLTARRREKGITP
jgi:hypothetical protein